MLPGKRLSYTISPCARRHKVPHGMLVLLIHCINGYRLLVSPYKTVMCSDFLNVQLPFTPRCGRWELYCHSDEVGGGSPLSRCGRWELCFHSDERWEVGVELPLRRGWRWESCYQMWNVGVLSPDVGGGSCAATPTKCGRWESHNLTTRQHDAS